MVTKTEVLNYLGNDYKQDGAELVFQCPLCTDEGGDSGRNHLKFNSKKGVITCFASDVHSKEIRKQIKARNVKSLEIRKRVSELKITPDLIKQTNETLLESETLLEQLEKATGIKATTVKTCKLGFSLECQVFIFPCYDKDGNLFGAEFRNFDFSKFSSGAKVLKAVGTVSTLCHVNFPENATKLIIGEGFKDAYNIVQHSSENDKSEEYQVVTPSNGVASIKKLLKDYETSKYEEVILCLDNDKAGRGATKNIALSMDRWIYQLKLPQVPDKDFIKDFSDWYNNCNDNPNLLYENIEPVVYSVIASKIGNPEKYALGIQTSKVLEEELLLKTQIVDYKGRYVQVCTKPINDVPHLCFTVLSNYLMEPVRNVLEVDQFDSNKIKYLLELCLVGDSGVKSAKLTLTPEDRANLRSFRTKVYEKGNYSDVLNDKQFAQILDNLYKENYLSKIYQYSMPGRTNDNVFLCQDAAIEIGTGKVFQKKGDTIKLEDGKEIILDDAVSNAPKLKHSEEHAPKQIAEKLITILTNGYNFSVQPFLVLGVASMSVFRDLFKDVAGGFPIPYLYGPTQGGKTNLLYYISYLYGFDKSFVSSGSSTVNATWKNLAKRSRIPVLMDEVLSQNRYVEPFENLLKCAYDCKKRERMFNGQKEDNQPVNATLILSSNQAPPQKEEVLNRLAYCEFDPKLFNVNDELISFNEIRDKYLSNLLIGFLSLTDEQLMQTFKANKLEVSEKYPNLRERDTNNMAIALTGIKSLFNIAETEIPEKLQESIDKYLGDYEQIYDVKSPLDKFISYIPLLQSEMKISSYSDYKVEDGKLFLHYALVYKHFAKAYRQTEGEQPPKSKDILNSAKYHTGIDKGSDQVAKSTYINGKKKRCLVVDVAQFDDLEEMTETPSNVIPTKVQPPQKPALTCIK